MSATTSEMAMRLHRVELRALAAEDRVTRLEEALSEIASFAKGDIYDIARQALKGSDAG